MFERVLGSLTGAIGAYLSKKIEEHEDIYSEEQARILREMESEEVSLSASWYSSSASSSNEERDPIGTQYFKDLEKRLGEDEFFKKEEFDVE